MAHLWSASHQNLLGRPKSICTITKYTAVAFKLQQFALRRYFSDFLPHLATAIIIIERPDLDFGVLKKNYPIGGMSFVHFRSLILTNFDILSGLGSEDDALCSKEKLWGVGIML